MHFARRDGEPQEIRFGRYPTPVYRVDALSNERRELWLKDDGSVHPEYGGNKVRKLELVLPRALAKGARRVVTMGAAGSHQVLATALFAKKLGLETVAVLCPQPWSEHAEQTLSASHALGIEVHVAGSMTALAPLALRVRRRGDYLIAPGGSSITGTLGYLRAAGELADQITAGLVPEPDLIVAPLGSGGTVAGLLAGVLREGLRSRVMGVEVAIPSRLGRALVLGLALGVTRRDGGSAGPVRLSRQLVVDGSELGAGYAHATPRGDHAMQVAEKAGLSLDPTYTAKTFAKVLELLESPNPEIPSRILYWHTLSSSPLGPLLSGAKSLPSELSALLVGRPSARKYGDS